MIDSGIGCLEFRLEANAQVGEIDEVPAREFPKRGVSIVFDADDQVHGVVGYLQGLLFWLEVKRAEGAFDGSLFDEFWIEVENQAGLVIGDSQVWVASPLISAVAGGRHLAGEAGQRADAGE